MKKLVMVLLVSVTFLSAYAGGNKKADNSKKDVKMKIRIHADRKGEVHINGSVSDLKEMEKMADRCLAGLSMRVDEGHGAKGKNVGLSITIREK